MVDRRVFLSGDENNTDFREEIMNSFTKRATTSLLALTMAGTVVTATRAQADDDVTLSYVAASMIWPARLPKLYP